MISGIKPKELLFRDGTSQSQRLNNALDPDAILVDERQLADFIRFAQEFAGKLCRQPGNDPEICPAASGAFCNVFKIIRHRSATNEWYEQTSPGLFLPPGARIS